MVGTNNKTHGDSFWDEKNWTVQSPPAQVLTFTAQSCHRKKKKNVFECWCCCSFQASTLTSPVVGKNCLPLSCSPVTDDSLSSLFEVMYTWLHMHCFSLRTVRKIRPTNWVYHMYCPSWERIKSVSNVISFEYTAGGKVKTQPIIE